LSSVFFRKIENFSNHYNRGESGTGQRAWLSPALRDVQRAEPWAVCPNCGGEQYSFDGMVPVGGGLWCAVCAAGQEREEKNEL
jgi:hypothetical protein